MAIALRFGFKEVKTENLRAPALKKGQKLQESGHVFNVEEFALKDGSFSIIKGEVMRQTSVNSPPYHVEIHLNKTREIERADCECAAGEGGKCKHICAIVAYINNDQAESKTSFSKEWGVPSVKKELREKYSKGKKISELCFLTASNRKTKKKEKSVNKKSKNVKKNDGALNKGTKRRGRKRKIKQPTESEPAEKSLKLIDVLPKIKNITCPVREMIMEEMKSADFRACEELVNWLVDSVVKKLETEEILEVMNIVINNQKEQLIFKNNEPSDSNIFKDEQCCFIYHCDVWLSTDNLISKIALDTLGQHEIEQWFLERKKRISASTAHDIKTRRIIDENFVKQFFFEKKIKGRGLYNFNYGHKMEPEARDKYEEKYQVKVTQVGLVVNKNQPWLCSSPDGIIKLNGKQVMLLEIKCPSSCAKKPIVEEDRINVGYLKWDQNGNIFLKKSDRYYTQIQFSMYVLNCQWCHFFVYSPAGEPVCLLIKRDDLFLKPVIKKLELFYFNYYLPEYIECLKNVSDKGKT